MKPLFTLTFFLISCLALHSQSIIFVDASSSGIQTGQNWATAFADLQEAIDEAGSGDSIFVRAGTYKPTTAAGNGTLSRDKAFVLKSGVHVFGGFSGTEQSLSQRDADSTALHIVNLTTLSGDLGTGNDSTDNAFHVVIAPGVITGTLDGFSIAHGHANGADSILVDGHLIRRYYGGGIYLKDGNMVIRNTVMTNNIASRGGGGVMAYNDLTEFSDCLFEFNSVNGNFPQDPMGGGGAMRVFNASLYVHESHFRNNVTRHNQGGGAIRHESSSEVLYENVRFSFNRATDGDGGGAVYSATGSYPTFNACVFYQNNTPDQGGAGYNDNSLPTFNDCVFSENTGESGAGAMENDGGSHVQYTRCQFLNNSTDADGGAIQNWKSSPVINDCLFDGNTAGNDGGALFNYTECSPLVTNCVFKNNTAVNDGGAIYNRRNCNSVVTNTLIYDNSAGQYGGGFITLMSNGEPSSPVGTNLTITGNQAGVAGGGIYDDGEGNSRLRNSIVFENTAPSDPDAYAPATIDIEAASHTVIGLSYFEDDLSVPIPWSGPIFLDISNDDFHLIQGGIAINSGDSFYYDTSATPDISTIVTDLDGAPRVQGSQVDLGCYESCHQVISLSVEISVSPNDTVEFQDEITLTAIADSGGLPIVYQWFRNGSPIAGANNQSLTLAAGVGFESADTFNVSIVASGFCLAEDSIMSDPVTLYYVPDTVNGIAEMGSQLDFQIYPNPVKNNETVFIATDNEVSEATVSDLTGRIILRESLNANTLSLPADMEAGVYILTLVSNSRSGSMRFVVYE